MLVLMRRHKHRGDAGPIEYHKLQLQRSGNSNGVWHRQKRARRSLAVPPAAQVHSLQGEYSECLLRVRSLLRRSQVQVAGSRLPCVLRTSVPDICKTGPGARRRCASGSPFLLSSCQHPNCSGCGGRMPTLLGPKAEMYSKDPKQVVRPTTVEGSVPLASDCPVSGTVCVSPRSYDP